MHDLWGEEPQPRPKKRQPVSRQPAILLTSQDCLMYGHSFASAGMSGEKLCQSCGIKGYCPVCMPIHRGDAQPFLCTLHSEGTVQA